MPQDQMLTGSLDPTCPPWCTPGQHLIDDHDTTLVVIHRSVGIVAGLGCLRIQQPVRRFGSRVVRGPVTISSQPAGPIELQTRAETVDLARDLTSALLALADNAWPTPARTSMRAS